MCRATTCGKGVVTPHGINDKIRSRLRRGSLALFVECRDPQGSRVSPLRLSLTRSKSRIEGGEAIKKRTKNSKEIIGRIMDECQPWGGGGVVYVLGAQRVNTQIKDREKIYVKVQADEGKKCKRFGRRGSRGYGVWARWRSQMSALRRRRSRN